MYALVEIKGKQYKVEKGSMIKVDRIHSNIGDSVELGSVLLTSDEGKVAVGLPFVKGIKVKAVVAEHGKGKKVLIYKYKRRKKYRKRQGHRAQFSVLRIEDITGA